VIVELHETIARWEIAVGAILIPKSGYDVDGGDGPDIIVHHSKRGLELFDPPYWLLAEKETDRLTNIPVLLVELEHCRGSRRNVLVGLGLREVRTLTILV